MTFSIVARSADGTTYGVAVASKFLAVGAVVPAAAAGVGALATQAWANLAYRRDGMALLGEGRSARETVDILVAADEQAADRQLGVVDAHGGSATYTGSTCLSWAGGVHGDGYAIQGNILTGPDVVEAMERAWLATDEGAPFARRLLAVIAAGDRAGGDARGRQSAAVYVVTPEGGYGGGSDVLVDLRVDDHADPVPELERLLDIHEMLFGRPDPDTCLPLEGPLAAEVAERLSRVGHEQDPVEAALASWAGVENLEERLVPGRIDPLVLEHLRLLTR
ncbi:MAG TPA: DUF1028 domain-containing protein [Actinomycetes bacterium]|nr:DUF1028 domain-containing protein [Actinomycetes bacterium]